MIQRFRMHLPATLFTLQYSGVHTSVFREEEKSVCWGTTHLTPACRQERRRSRVITWLT